MRIAIFCAGGTGGYLGALLARSGNQVSNQVSMIARVDQFHVRWFALRSYGILV